MKLRKIMASILCFALVLSTMSFHAFAAETTSVAKIGEIGYESLDAALTAAKKAGHTEVEITVTGDIKLSGAIKDFTKVTFTGTNREQTVDMNLGSAIDVNTELVFNNLTVSRLDGGVNGWLYHYTYIRGGLTYNNCKMIGVFNVTAQDTNFIGCDFYNDDTFGDGNYSLWLYNCAEGVEVNITDCTFDVYERAIKMYGDGYNGAMTLNISGTEFTSRTADKTVVEMAYDNANLGTGTMALNIDSESTASGFGAPEHIEGEANAWFNVECVLADKTAGDIGTYTDSTVTIGGEVTYESKPPVEVATYDELVAALANGNDVKLTADIDITTSFTTTTDATIDLNGKTLNIKVGEVNFSGCDVTIKNGTINISGVVATADAIFNIGKTEAATLTLDTVNVTGNTYSSAYGVFYIRANSTLNINGGSVKLSNEQARYADGTTSGGVFKADGASASLNITGATMELYNVQKVITHATTTIEDSNISIKGDAEVSDKMEHGINRSALTVTNSTITMENLVGRGITAENGAVTISGNSTVTIANAQEATIDVRKSQTVTVDTTSTVTVDAEPTITSGTISGVTVNVPPKGNVPYAYTSATTIWGETWSNATESYVIKVLDADGNVMGTTTLNPELYDFAGMNGNVAPTWHISLDPSTDTDTYWIQKWTTDPSIANQPAKVELWVDGVKVNEGSVQLNEADDKNKKCAAVTDANGKILSYVGITDNSCGSDFTAAFKTALSAGGNIVMLRDVTLTETLEIPANTTVNLDLNGKTITGTIAVSGNLTIKDSVGGGNVNGTITKNNAAVIEISGGTYAQDVSAWCVDGYVATKNADGTYSVYKAPNATVTVLDPMTLTAAEHDYMVWPSGDDTIERPLEVVMNFKANETLDEAAAGGFGKWKTDFYLKVTGLATGSITADDCYLAGNYGTYGWIVIPTDGTVIEEGVSYPIVSNYDPNLTYENVCDYVKDFTAAIHIDPAILEANPNFKVELSLKMTNPNVADDVLVIGEPAVYDVEDLMGEKTEYFNSKLYVLRTFSPMTIPATETEIIEQLGAEKAYRVRVYAAVEDPANYTELGFAYKLLNAADNTAQSSKIKTLYKKVTITSGNEGTVPYYPTNFRADGKYIFALNIWINPAKYTGKTVLEVKPYGVKKDGTTIYAEEWKSTGAIDGTDVTETDAE